MKVDFVDTTLRDGSQSLWASGMRSGMMEAVADDLDKVGFKFIEIPTNSIFFKKIVRDLKEDPWALMRTLAEKMPDTDTGSMSANLNINAFGTPTPRVVGKLFYKLLAEMGALRRSQMVANTADQISRDFAELEELFRPLGVKMVPAIAFTISPRHTNEYFAEKTRQCAEFKPDAIYIKDPGGLMTVDRLRELAPVMLEAAGGIPLELHSHCTVGVAPQVYMEALELGIPALHTGIPPLAEGSAQPSVFQTVLNARALGHEVDLDMDRLQRTSAKLTGFAKMDGMPIGQPMPYDRAQYIHQIPGGVISNLRHQLKAIGMAERVDEVIEESIKVKAEMGYPMMITPFSQYVCTQAAMNLQTGERYKMVLDEVILFAMGRYGEDSGYQHMDENLRDRLLGSKRAAELAAKSDDRALKEMTSKEARALYGGPDMSDEELVLRAIMQGTTGDIDAMRAAGPWRRYDGADPALTRLLQHFSRSENVRFMEIRKGADVVSMQR